MPGLIFNALFSSFFMVKLVRGRWTRNPDHLAAATVASVCALIILNCWSPGAAASFIYGNLAALGGAWLGLFVYGRIAGAL